MNKLLTPDEAAKSFLADITKAAQEYQDATGCSDGYKHEVAAYIANCVGASLAKEAP